MRKVEIFIQLASYIQTDCRTQIGFWLWNQEPSIWVTDIYCNIHGEVLLLVVKCKISCIRKNLRKERKLIFHSPLNQCFSPIHFFNFDTIFPATRLDSILLGFEASFACKEPFRPKRVIIPCQEQMRSLSFMPEPFSWQRILRNYPCACRLPATAWIFFATK